MHSNIFFHLILIIPNVGESLLPPTNWITCDELSIAVFHYIWLCTLLYVDLSQRKRSVFALNWISSIINDTVIVTHFKHLILHWPTTRAKATFEIRNLNWNTGDTATIYS